jgi:hypothetical protein
LNDGIESCARVLFDQPTQHVQKKDADVTYGNYQTGLGDPLNNCLDSHELKVSDNFPH